MQRKEKRGKRDKKIIVCVTPTEKGVFQKRCKDSGRTMSGGVRYLIDKELKTKIN